MSRLKFKDMTIDQLQALAVEAGKKCTDAERKFLDDIALRSHGGLAWTLAISHWRQRGNRWNENMRLYKTALMRVQKRRRDTVGRARNFGLKNPDYANRDD